MLKLEDIKKDAQIRGLEGDKIVRIILAEPVAANRLMSSTLIKRVSQARNHCFALMNYV
ncbi:MAG: hypothetical protein Q7U66_05550 [Methylobacter sp.]|nr:hypothetical protein [Methylobacter sp.]